MNTKFYVSFDTAKLLEEKGCNIERDFLTHVYKENGHLYWSSHEDLSNEIPAPTKAEAIDWIESNGIIIEVLQDYRGLWFYVIKISETESYVSESDDKYFPTRLEAEEAAINKVLTEFL